MLYRIQYIIHLRTVDIMISTVDANFDTHELTINYIIGQNPELRNAICYKNDVLLLLNFGTM